MDGTVLLIDYFEYEREKTKIIFDNIGEYDFIEVEKLSLSKKKVLRFCRQSETIPGLPTRRLLLPPNPTIRAIVMRRSSSK